MKQAQNHKLYITDLGKQKTHVSHLSYKKKEKEKRMLMSCIEPTEIT